ncbi:MAG: hypothetical protein ACKKL5_02250 [Candidatus Komeilibacteria bacterium]
MRDKVLLKKMQLRFKQIIYLALVFISSLSLYTHNQGQGGGELLQTLVMTAIGIGLLIMALHYIKTKVKMFFHL